MLTLNQIKTQLKDFFTDHAQVNDVKYEDDFDFNSQRHLTYPVCNIEYINTQVADKKMNHRYKIVLADLVNQNIEQHADEIYSDMMLVAEDFFGWLQYQEEGLFFDRSTSLEKFEDDTHDRAAGLVFTITLSTIRSQNDCEKPTR